ncbi:hypothetical protein AAG906_017143 [Vitis piasezkii]
MLAGFVKCGNVEDAFGMFSEMPCRDVVSWNSMLACYAQCGKLNEALALFDQMRAVVEATVVSLLSACAHLGALDKGLHFHTYINDNRTEVNSIVGTALVDMYAKCGKISLATQVFNAMESKDVLAWNTIIASMAIHGHVKNLGMSGDYGIEPKVEHYGCVIDLLAVRGTMPMEPNPCALGALLGGCRIHGNFEWVRCYILLSNIYAAAKKWDDARKVRNLGRKAAIAYGLLHLDSKEAIRIVKNLRVCEIDTINYCKGSESVSSF